MQAQRCPRVFAALTQALVVIGAAAPPAEAQHETHSLGTVTMTVGCAAAAQAEFNRGLALLHHMTYPQARSAFERVASLDPACAMAHWGVAMTLFQPLWPTRPSPADLRRGWEAVERANALSMTDRERKFMATAEAFFREPESADYWLRIRRWRTATADLHASLPDDIEAGAFHALALLATAPTDTGARASADQAATILLGIHARAPDHPGANHYIVHSSDVTGRERESLEITRKYDEVAPRNPHALHMPTHIYTRLGEWTNAISGNLRAAEAALEIPAGDKGQFVWDEFPHAIEYVVYAYLQRGMDDSAAAQVRRLHATERLEPTFKTAFHLASTRARHALERRNWVEAAAVKPREPGFLNWDRFAWPEAIAEFAHGLGSVRQSGTAAAGTASSDRLAVLDSMMQSAGEMLFARNIRILRLELDAWRAHAAGENDKAVSLLREATELEVTTPKHAVTPAPTIPAHEWAGDLYMLLNRPELALTEYQRALELYPKRLNSLAGAARAARSARNTALSRRYYKELLAISDPSSRRPEVLEARDRTGSGGRASP
jgi:tetratricopeptide (TPR) repeat protein